MEIKKILPDERGNAVRLVSEVFMKFEAPDYTEEGVNAFFDTAVNNADFLNSLAIYGAYFDDKLVGVIATRNNGNHIALFFVEGSYHRQGIGRKLFEVVLENATFGEITVNSSPYAAEAYHRLGFDDTDVAQTITGIRFIPMRYKK